MSLGRFLLAKERLPQKDFCPLSPKDFCPLSGWVGEAASGFGEGHFPGLVAAASLAAGDRGPRISIGDVAEVALANLVRSDANLDSVNYGQLRLMTFYLDGQVFSLFLYGCSYQIAPLGP